jgi:lipopolysaccharide/colanic/teichoic acid biosynthesis glycosyltransferase
VEDAERKLELDLYYLAEGSWGLDALVLLRTLTRVGRGAR